MPYYVIAKQIQNVTELTCPGYSGYLVQKRAVLATPLGHPFKKSVLRSR